MKAAIVLLKEICVLCRSRAMNVAHQSRAEMSQTTDMLVLRDSVPFYLASIECARVEHIEETVLGVGKMMPLAGARALPMRTAPGLVSHLSLRCKRDHCRGLETRLQTIAGCSWAPEENVYRQMRAGTCRKDSHVRLLALRWFSKYVADRSAPFASARHPSRLQGIRSGSGREPVRSRARRTPESAQRCLLVPTVPPRPSSKSPVGARLGSRSPRVGRRGARGGGRAGQWP